MADVNPLRDAVMSYLRRRGWQVEVDEPSGIIALEQPGADDPALYTVVAVVREDDRQVLIYSACPPDVPEHRRAAVAELLTRANYGLFIGNFELDLDDGEVRFKTGVDVEGTDVDDALLDGLLRANLATMDTYLGAILDVAAGDADVSEALATTEADIG
ncbi:MAG: YbjN domain-containing protein [Pseudonocardiaceae bacterium]|nr:YbjN domain-containing protein [Pseudonocardiaceae bacterium]